MHPPLDDRRAVVGDADAHPGIVLHAKGHAHIRAVGGIFDGVAENVEQGGLEFVGIAAHQHGQLRSFNTEGDGLFFEMMTGDGGANALLDQRAHIDGDAGVRTGTLADFAGFEHLLDGGEQTVAVGEHAGVELAALGLLELTALQDKIRRTFGSLTGRDLSTNARVRRALAEALA